MAAPLALADASGTRRGKWAPLFDALGHRHELTDVVQPAVIGNRFIRAGLSRLPQPPGRAPARFRRWSDEVETRLESADPFDLAFLLGSRLAPGSEPGRYPFVIYTDNTFALTVRYYPQWNAMSKTDRTDLLELEQETCREARFVFTTSKWARRSMIEDYGCAPERVLAVGGGTAVEPELRKSSWERRVALFVGIEFERKGGRTLLAAWPDVRTRVPDAELWIVGPRFKPSLRLPAGVRWLGRVEDRHTLTSLYREASVFVMPSWFEPWGFVFHEAMAAGVPCVGASVCAMPEIISDGITGRLVRPADAAELGDTVSAILGDPELAEQMGRKGFREVRDHHQWAHVAARIDDSLHPVSVDDVQPLGR